MSYQIIPTARVAGLEALELAGALGLTVWLDLGTGRGPHPAYDASAAWAEIRNSGGGISARDFYTFEPENESR